MKLTIKILVALVLFSCNKNKNNQQQETEEQPSFSAYKIISEELLKNSDLKSWDTNAKPTHWEINEAAEKPEDYVIDRDTLDLLLRGHKNKDIFLKQTLNIEPNSFYILSCRTGTSLKSDSYAGILITQNDNILGKRIFNKKDENTYNIVFHSEDGKNITFFFGYIEAGEGNIKIKDMSLKKIRINSNVFDSAIAKEFQATLSLTMDSAVGFDESIAKIIRHTSDLLLSKKRKDTLNINNAIALDRLLDKGSFMKKYFKIDKNQITKSYPTRLVYSTVDILNEFNIGTQRIELHRDNKRVHLLLNYYNPFSKKWKTIDPFYNSSIDSDRDLSLIKKHRVQLKDYGGLSKNIDGLVKKYTGTKTVLKKEKTISYPF